MGDIFGGENYKTITEEMKGLTSSSINNIHDFLQDAQSFLEQTLSSEKLSRLALEHRSRLVTKLSSLMKEYENHQMEMYIDMSPALRSFFHPSDASSSDNGSEKEPIPYSEEFYDVPNRESVPDFDQPAAEDECDAPPTTNPLPPAPETKKKGFMHRLLKSRSKASDLASTFSLAAIKAQQNRLAPDEDNKSRRESEDSDILYDDTLTVKPSTAEEFSNEEASAIPKNSENVKQIYTNETSVKTSDEEDLIYDDASRVNDTNEEYEYVANESISSVRELQNNNNESDGISMKSGVSDYGANAPSHRWHITASDAKAQALRCGYMKRRNGRKLLSAWRHCYSVLLPSHLLMYVNDGDSRPRIVIDLTEPNIRVKRVIKQGADTKRLKTHPFVLLHEERALYEISTKSRDETEEWIMALQAILIQVGGSIELQTEKINEDCYSDYDQPLEHIKKKDVQSRMESIQGRNLPSLPATEQENNPPQQLQKTAKVNGRMATLFRFRGRSSSSEEDQSNKRQSINSITSAMDDVYQELPSPTASTTPYSSVENLKQSMEDIYNSVEDVASINTRDLSANKNSAPVQEGNIQHSRSLSDGLVIWPNPHPESLPVYDIPSPTIRPLSTLSVSSNEVGSNGTTGLKNHQRETRKFVIFNEEARKQSSSGSVNVVSDCPEVYDVPVTNPRRISIIENENEELIAYDRVTTPPRTVIPLPEVNSLPPPPPPTPATKKIARYWQEKIGQGDKPLSTPKKDNSPPTKCLPKPTSVEKIMPLAEIKSVGRCFSRTSPQRTPLTSLSSLTELLASSKNGVDIQLIKPSTLRTNVANKNGLLTGIKVGGKHGNTSFSTFSPGIKVSNIDNSSSNKKEPPPRPPAPVRPPLAIKANEPINLADELNRKLMKRVIKNEEVCKEQLPVTESNNMIDSIVATLNKTVNAKEQYKARWAYVATNSLELSINSGEIVQVLTKGDVSWQVQARNRKGLVPKEYLVPMAANVLSLTKVGEAPITV